MAEQKVPDLTALSETPANGDLIHIVDVSDDTYDGGTSKKITWANLVKNYVDGLISTLTSSLSSHAADTTTHGTTGDIVGTSDTQTLTNKTLTSPVLETGVSGTAVDTDGTLASNSDTKLASQKAVKTYVDTTTASIGNNGWSPATGTWTYASATTITVPSGATSIYQIGDKFKLTANSVVLYGYIVTVADTLLTVKGDALTNHAFTANYFSKSTNPQGFPTAFNYTPTITGYGTPPSTPFARFHILGRIVYVQVATGNATSNANTFTVSLPVAAKTLSGATWRNKPSNLVDNGTNSTTADFVFIDSGSSVAALAKNTSSVGFTTSGSKGVEFQIWYEI